MLRVPCPGIHNGAPVSISFQLNDDYVCDRGACLHAFRVSFHYICDSVTTDPYNVAARCVTS